MSPRQPVQKRSRERMEQVLLAAADQLAKAGNADELTTTSVSKRSGVPVATIYRYFADRMAIITTLIDRETAEIDTAVANQLNQLDVVSMQILLETIMTAHLRHFQTHRRAIVLWFGARHSSKVITRVDRRYKSLGEWVFEGSKAAGFLTTDVPEFGGEGIVWLSDRIFEYIFREQRTADEQQAIFHEFLEMMATQINKYATPAGINGIPREEFLAKAGEYAPLSGNPDTD